MKTTVVYVRFICQGQCKFKSMCRSPHHSHPLDWKKNQSMVLNVFVVDQAAQTYNIMKNVYSSKYFDYE